MTGYMRLPRGVAWLSMALAFLPAKVLAECSSDFVGLATINEVSDKDQFIEAKLLSSSIDSSVYSQWSLDFCSTNGKNNPTVECAFDLPLSGAGVDTTGEPWLVLTGLGSASVDLAGMDVRLKDAEGRTIDYLQVGQGAGDPRVPDPDCEAGDLPYDSYLPVVGGQAGQFARRLPDGTGEWSMATGASDGKSTDSDTNDESATGPAINIYGDSVFAGTTANFRVGLPEGQVASQDIQIQYQTEDNSAIAPGDYVARSGTVTLSTGTREVAISVSTNADQDADVERFYLRITDVSYGIPESVIAIGEIWPATVGWWAFENGPWTTSGDVLDRSGNDLHGSASGGVSSLSTSPARPGDPGTCRYAGFEGRFFAPDYVDVPDDPLLDLGASVTVAAWVRPQDYSPFERSTVLSKGRNYALHISDNGNVQWQWDDSSGISRTLATNSRPVPEGSWTHVAVTHRSGEQLIYVNGQVVAQAQVTGGLDTGTSPLRFGNDHDWVSLFRYFYGVLDEIRLYSAALPADAIEVIYQRTHPCASSSALASLVVSAPATASVCGPIDVRLTAYDGNGDMLENYAGTVTLSTSSNHGRWGSGSGAGVLSPDPDSTDDGAASYQFAPDDNGDATLAFANTHADELVFTVADQNASITATSDPVTFAENALYIESNDVLADDLIAGRIHSYQVSMLRKDPDSGECGVAADYDGTYNLKAWLDREADDPGGDAPVLASSDDSVSLPDSAPSADNLNVTFGGGTAAVSLAPSDVGHYTLNLLDDTSGFAQASDGTPLPIVSASAAGAWTARPFAIALEVPGNPGAQDATGPSFQAAGETFTLRVGGALYDTEDDTDGDGVADAGANLMDNSFAASFGQEGESVALAADLLAPTDGTNPGLDGPMLDPSDYVGGVASPTDFRFSEVGIIDVSGEIGDGNYLGAGSARTARMDGTTGPVGRFIPHHFTVSVDDDGVIEAVCAAGGGFTYSGQDSGWALEPTIEVIPENQAGAQTRNYLVGGFMRLLPGGVSRTWPTQDESALLSDGATPHPVTVENNAGEILPRSDGDPILYRYSSDDVIRYNKSPDALVVPFTPSLTFEVDGVVDEDGVLALDTGPNSSVPLALTPASDGEIFYGRRVMENVYGPETAEELLMPFSMEYWTANGFAVNSDNCTDWVVDSSLEDDEQYHTLASRGDTGTFVDGLADPLVLEPSGTPGEERLTWLVPVWQQHDWNGDNTLQDPSAIATFGVYRGHDRIIYWREVPD